MSMTKHGRRFLPVACSSLVALALIAHSAVGGTSLAASPLRLAFLLFPQSEEFGNVRYEILASLLVVPSLVLAAALRKVLAFKIACANLVFACCPLFISGAAYLPGTLILLCLTGIYAARDRSDRSNDILAWAVHIPYVAFLVNIPNYFFSVS